MMRYADAYRYGKDALEAAQVAEAKLDARLLLEAVCGTSGNDLLVHGDRELSQEQEERYREWIVLRASRIPLQHITGVQEFMGLEFLVNEHVLIPRQDTEILVEEVLRELTDGSRILDLCTGSGCILLCLLVFPVRLHKRGQVALLLHQRAETLLIRRHVRLVQFVHDLLVPMKQILKSVKHLSQSPFHPLKSIP